MNQDSSVQSLFQQPQVNKELCKADRIFMNGQLFNAIRNKNKSPEEKSRKIEKLLSGGADVNAKDANDGNNTLLHISVLKGEPEIVEVLLDRGAIINNKNTDGKTPLDIAELPDTPNGKTIVNILEKHVRSHSQPSNQEASPEQSYLINNPLEELPSVLQHPQEKRTETDFKRKKRKRTELIYSKRPGTSSLSGQLYETKLLALLLFRALKDKEINEFYLGTNVDGIGALDDLIFRYTLNGQQNPRFIFIQAKYKDNPDKDKITVRKIREKDGEFSLCKYFDSYLRIRQRFKAKNNDIPFKGNYGDIDFDFVIYTTAKEDFNKKFIEQFNTRKDDLIYTRETGKIFQFQYEDDDIKLLMKALSESHTKLLAENLAKFIFSNKPKFSFMMSDELIKRYHVVLAQKVIKVSHTESGDHSKGKFRPEFFDSNEELLLILKKTLYEEILVKYSNKLKFQPKEIKDLVGEILKNPCACIISKSIGSILTYDAENKRLKFIEKKIPHEIIHLKDGLEKMEIMQETVKKAIEIAGKEKLEKLDFKLPSTFGNINYKARGEESLKRLTSKFIMLLTNDCVTRNNIVKIDENVVGHKTILNDGDMAINGGFGGLVGNLFILDEETKLLKFNNDVETLPEMSKQLFEMLKREISENENLKDKDLSSYKFAINVNDFPRLSFISKECDKKLVKGFLGKLRFYTNQAKEDEVEKILKKDIYKHYKSNKKQNEFTFHLTNDAIFLKVHDEVQKWWKQPKTARYLTKSCNFFDQAAEDFIDGPLLTTMNFMYVNKLRKSNIEFNRNAIQTLELDEFTASTDERILKINTDEYILSSVKLAQYFKNKNSNNHTFMDLDYVSGTGHYEQAISDFEDGILDIFIIGCKELFVDSNINIEGLKRITNNRSRYRKIILVSKRNDILAESFQKSFPGKYIEKEDKKNSLIDLTHESQLKLLEDSKVIFQGEEVILDKLIKYNLKHLIDREVLSKLINNEKVEIGKTLTNSRYEGVIDYLITRNFNYTVEIKKEFEKAKSETQKLKFLVTYNNRIIESNLQSGQDIVLISDTGESFKELCETYDEYNIHWLKNEGNKFIWQQTHGNLSELRKYVKKDKQSITSHELREITNITQKVVIIAGESGMGKSTVLTHLAVKMKKYHPFMTIIKINLVDHSSEFSKWQNDKIKIGKAEAVEFLYRAADFQAFTKLTKEKKEQMITNILELVTIGNDDEIVLKNNEETNIKGLVLLEIGLFNYFYNQGKITLLFDGFDEICPDFKEKVIELLKILKNTKAEKIWITTRPYDIRDELENDLSTFSYTLEQFSPEDQKKFIGIFWRKSLKLDELNNDRYDIFANEALKRFSQSINYQDIEFMGIPLQIRMIAEVFQSMFEEFYYSVDQELDDYKEKLSEKLNLLTLYEHFIKVKFYGIRFGEKKPGMNKKDTDIQRMTVDMYETFIETHRKLALFELFKENKLGKLLFTQERKKDLRTSIGKIKEAVEKMGIIDQVIDDKICFIHHTFAEYFAASYVWDKFKSIDITGFERFFIEILTECSNLGIYKFFELMAQKDLENDIKFDGRESKVKILFEYLVSEIRIYSSHEHNKQPIKLLLKIVELLLSSQEINGQLIIKDVVQSKIEDNIKLALLSVSAEMGYIKLADALIRIASEELSPQVLQNYLKSDEWLFSPLWLAAKNGHLEVVQSLVEKLSYDTAWKDKNNNALLQSILYANDFDVLRSCLKLDIVDVSRTYHDLNHREASPLVHCVTLGAPSDVIELLIGKTDSDFINQFRVDNMPAIVHVIGHLTHYDKNFINLLVEKDIDLNAGYKDKKTPINIITFQFKYCSVAVPDYFLGNPQFDRYIFYSDKEFSKFFNLVKTLLEYGAIYNLEDRNNNTVLQNVQQTHYIHELFLQIFQRGNKMKEIHIIHNVIVEFSTGIVTVSNLLDAISDKVLQSMIKKPDVHGYKISINSDLEEIALLPIYHNCTLGRKIFFVPKYIQSLFYQAYENGDTEGTVITDTLSELSLYKEKFQEELQKLKHGGYRVFDILKELKKKENTSTKSSVMGLLKRVITFYIDQNYEIDEAFTEVSEEVVKLSEKIQSFIKEVPKRGEQEHQERVYESDEILNILGIKDRVMEDLELIRVKEYLMTRNIEPLIPLIQIIEKLDGICFLNDVLLKLNSIGKKKKTEVLKYILRLKFSEQCFETNNLLHIIDILFIDIRAGNVKSIVIILQNSFKYRNAIFNARNKRRQTLLDFAYEYYNIGIINLLHKYGAKFNCNDDYLDAFSGSQIQSCLSHSTLCSIQENIDEFNAEK